MHVLVCLMEQPGQVVSREYLLATVWAGAVVNEDMVTRTVSSLRKVLGQHATSAGYIETIPKVGYRLVAPVRAISKEPLALPTPPVDRRIWWIGGFALILGVAGVVWMLATTPDEPVLTPLRATPLTTFPGREIRPALSPDGHYLAFSWQGEKGDSWDVYVMGISGNEPLRLTDHPGVDVGAAWSPNEQHIAFMRYHDGTCMLLRIPALGGTEQRLGDCGKNASADLAWSPDGQWLAYADQPIPDSSFRLMRLHIATGKTVALTAPDAQHWGDSSPAFSPDGRWIAFSRSVSINTQDLFIVPTSGGPAERITHDKSLLAGVTWDRDGEHLIAASGRGGSLGLWRISRHGGTPTWIAAAGHDAMWPRRARHGSGLVFTERRTLLNLWRYHLADTSQAPTALLPASRSHYHPAYAPDGRRLAYISTASGFPELWISLDSTQTRLTSFEGSALGSPRWSPNGQRIVFDVRVDGQADVYTIRADGNDLAQVTDHPASDVAPSWSPDGRHLYFGSNRSGSWQIWRYTEDTADVQRLTTEGGYAVLASLDNQRLFFSRYDEPGLWARDLPEGKPYPLHGTEMLQGLQNWDVTGAGVYFIDMHQGHLFLGHYTTRNLRSKPVLRLSSPPPDRRSFAIAPDGQTAVFTQVTHDASDIMIIRDF